MAVQMSLEFDTNHPFDEELEKKIESAKLRLRLVKSALKCDIRDLTERGHIKGFARRNREFYDDWIAQQYKRVAELEQLVNDLEKVKIERVNKL